MRNYLVRRNNCGNAFSIFDDAFDNFFKPVNAVDKFDNMKTDIKAVENGYQFEIEMAGFNKDEINLSVNEGYLTVSAKKLEEEKDNKYVRKERTFSCERSYYVGEVDEENIKAKYENGVLLINIPNKAEKDKDKKQIVIE